MTTSHPPSEAAARRRGGRSLNSVAIQLSAFALTFILVAILVVTSSRAAFVAQNDNTTNQVTAGAVDLTDNDSTTAMFPGVTGLRPGVASYSCIDVTYTGTVDPLPVRLYASGAPAGTLAPYLDLTVEIGADTTDAFRTCTNFVATGLPLYTGTLSDFATAHGTYATGAATWNPADTGETRTFRFGLTVQDDPLAEGLTSTFGFSWETRTS
jgi:hypothetical protein